MRITIEQYPENPKYYKKVTIEVADDTDIHDMIDEYANALIALGFHYDTVKKGILEKAEQYEVDDANV